MGRQPAQLVEFGVVAFGEDAAIAGEHRRLRDDRRCQQVRVLAVFAEFGGERLQSRRIQRRQERAQRRQQAEAIAQRRQVARTRAAQRDAGEDALEVAKCAERFPHVAIGTSVDQRRDCMLAFAKHAPIAQRPV